MACNFAKNWHWKFFSTSFERSRKYHLRSISSRSWHYFSGTNFFLKGNVETKIHCKGHLFCKYCLHSQSNWTAFSFTRSLASLSFSNSLINFVILKLISSLWSTIDLASDPEGVKIVTSGGEVYFIKLPHIQLQKMNMASLLNMPYVNEVTLTEQNLAI